MSTHFPTQGLPIDIDKADLKPEEHLDHNRPAELVNRAEQLLFELRESGFEIETIECVIDYIAKLAHRRSGRQEEYELRGVERYINALLAVSRTVRE